MLMLLLMMIIMMMLTFPFVPNSWCSAWSWWCWWSWCWWSWWIMIMTMIMIWHSICVCSHIYWVCILNAQGNTNSQVVQMTSHANMFKWYHMPICWPGGKDPPSLHVFWPPTHPCTYLLGSCPNDEHLQFYMWCPFSFKLCLAVFKAKRLQVWRKVLKLIPILKLRNFAICHNMLRGASSKAAILVVSDKGHIWKVCFTKIYCWASYKIPILCNVEKIGSFYRMRHNCCQLWSF